MMFEIKVVLPFTIFLLMTVGSVWAYRVEKRLWNKGIASSGQKWELRDMDSQGGRMYATSDKSDGYIWVPWKVDR